MFGHHTAPIRVDAKIFNAINVHYVRPLHCIGVADRPVTVCRECIQISNVFQFVLVGSQPKYMWMQLRTNTTDTKARTGDKLFQFAVSLITVIDLGFDFVQYRLASFDVLACIVFILMAGVVPMFCVATCIAALWVVALI